MAIRNDDVVSQCILETLLRNNGDVIDNDFVDGCSDDMTHLSRVTHVSQFQDGCQTLQQPAAEVDGTPLSVVAKRTSCNVEVRKLFGKRGFCPAEISDAYGALIDNQLLRLQGLAQERPSATVDDYYLQLPRYTGGLQLSLRMLQLINCQSTKSKKTQICSNSKSSQTEIRAIDTAQLLDVNDGLDPECIHIMEEVLENLSSSANDSASLESWFNSDVLVVPPCSDFRTCIANQELLGPFLRRLDEAYTRLVIERELTGLLKTSLRRLFQPGNVDIFYPSGAKLKPQQRICRCVSGCCDFHVTTDEEFYDTETDDDHDDGRPMLENDKCRPLKLQNKNRELQRPTLFTSLTENKESTLLENENCKCRRISVPENKDCKCTLVKNKRSIPSVPEDDDFHRSILDRLKNIECEYYKLRQHLAAEKQALLDKIETLSKEIFRKKDIHTGLVSVGVDVATNSDSSGFLERIQDGVKPKYINGKQPGRATTEIIYTWEENSEETFQNYPPEYADDLQRVKVELANLKRENAELWKELSQINQAIRARSVFSFDNSVSLLSSSPRYLKSPPFDDIDEEDEEEKDVGLDGGLNGRLDGGLRREGGQDEMSEEEDEVGDTTRENEKDVEGVEENRNDSCDRKREIGVGWNEGDTDTLWRKIWEASKAESMDDECFSGLRSASSLTDMAFYKHVADISVAASPMTPVTMLTSPMTSMTMMTSPMTSVTTLTSPMTPPSRMFTSESNDSSWSTGSVERPRSRSSETSTDNEDERELDGQTQEFTYRTLNNVWNKYRDDEKLKSMSLSDNEATEMFQMNFSDRWNDDNGTSAFGTNDSEFNDNHDNDWPEDITLIKPASLPREAFLKIVDKNEIYETSNEGPDIDAFGSNDNKTHTESLGIRTRNIFDDKYHVYTVPTTISKKENDVVEEDVVWSSRTAARGRGGWRQDIALRYTKADNDKPNDFAEVHHQSSNSASLSNSFQNATDKTTIHSTTQLLNASPSTSTTSKPAKLHYIPRPIVTSFGSPPQYTPPSVPNLAESPQNPNPESQTLNPIGAKASYQEAETKLNKSSAISSSLLGSQLNCSEGLVTLTQPERLSTTVLHSGQTEPKHLKRYLPVFPDFESRASADLSARDPEKWTPSSSATISPQMENFADVNSSKIVHTAPMSERHNTKELLLQTKVSTPASSGTGERVLDYSTSASSLKTVEMSTQMNQVMVDDHSGVNAIENDANEAEENLVRKSSSVFQSSLTSSSAEIKLYKSNLQNNVLQTPIAQIQVVRAGPIILQNRSIDLCGVKQVVRTVHSSECAPLQYQHSVEKRLIKDNVDIAPTRRCISKMDTIEKPITIPIPNSAESPRMQETSDRLSKSETLVQTSTQASSSHREPVSAPGPTYVTKLLLFNQAKPPKAKLRRSLNSQPILASGDVHAPNSIVSDSLHSSRSALTSHVSLAEEKVGHLLPTIPPTPPSSIPPPLMITDSFDSVASDIANCLRLQNLELHQGIELQCITGSSQSTSNGFTNEKNGRFGASLEKKGNEKLSQNGTEIHKPDITFLTKVQQSETVNGSLSDNDAYNEIGLRNFAIIQDTSRTNSDSETAMLSNNAGTVKSHANSSELNLTADLRSHFNVDQYRLPSPLRPSQYMTKVIDEKPQMTDTCKRGKAFGGRTGEESLQLSAEKTTKTSDLALENFRKKIALFEVKQDAVQKNVTKLEPKQNLKKRDSIDIAEVNRYQNVAHDKDNDGMSRSFYSPGIDQRKNEQEHQLDAVVSQSKVDQEIQTLVGERLLADETLVINESRNERNNSSRGHLDRFTQTSFRSRSVDSPRKQRQTSGTARSKETGSLRDETVDDSSEAEESRDQRSRHTRRKKQHKGHVLEHRSRESRRHGKKFATTSDTTDSEVRSERVERSRLLAMEGMIVDMKRKLFEAELAAVDKTSLESRLSALEGKLDDRSAYSLIGDERRDRDRTNVDVAQKSVIRRLSDNGLPGDAVKDCGSDESAKTAKQPTASEDLRSKYEELAKLSMQLRTALSPLRARIARLNQKCHIKTELIAKLADGLSEQKSLDDDVRKIVERETEELSIPQYTARPISYLAETNINQLLKEMTNSIQKAPIPLPRRSKTKDIPVNNNMSVVDSTSIHGILDRAVNNIGLEIDSSYLEVANERNDLTRLHPDMRFARNYAAWHTDMLDFQGTLAARQTYELPPRYHSYTDLHFEQRKSGAQMPGTAQTQEQKRPKSNGQFSPPQSFQLHSRSYNSAACIMSNDNRAGIMPRNTSTLVLPGEYTPGIMPISYLPETVPINDSPRICSPVIVNSSNSANHLSSYSIENNLLSKNLLGGPTQLCIDSTGIPTNNSVTGPSSHSSLITPKSRQTSLDHILPMNGVSNSESQISDKMGDRLKQTDTSSSSGVTQQSISDQNHEQEVSSSENGNHISQRHLAVYVARDSRTENETLSQRQIMNNCDENEVLKTLLNGEVIKLPSDKREKDSSAISSESVGIQNDIVVKSDPDQRFPPSDVDAERYADCRPGAPRGLHVQKLTEAGDVCSVLISWLPPEMDQLTCSNGSLVAGYQLSVDERLVQFVSGAHVRRAVIERVSLPKTKGGGGRGGEGEEVQGARDTEADGNGKQALGVVFRIQTVSENGLVSEPLQISLDILSRTDPSTAVADNF